MAYPICQWSTSTKRQRSSKFILSASKKLRTSTVCLRRNGASGYPNASAAKSRKCTLKRPSGQREDYAALKQALLVQFELTAEAYHKKFRGSRLERRETYGNLCEMLDKYLIRWHALSQMPETFDGLASLILSEQLLECISPEIRVYVKEQQATAPADIASAADRYLNARKDLKGKATATDQQTDQPTSPAQSNLAPKTPQQSLAPGWQSAPNNHNNRPNHQSRYNQANYSKRDSRHGARDSRPTPQRQQQATRILSMVTPVPQPSAIEPSDTYVFSTMAVAPQPPAIDISQPELPPVLPNPTSAPPGVETILANGV
ncbi:zinc finger protein [Biomphalaria pfeifferi]|uniref:Zinc finger protein n=1 Tax=Biomphalaria pfeifferi TaxID=112525 RepID=A0AAD8BK67_BIOPF|nr:zinc finger protein [Biomphalaria pfeifferi]